MFFNDSVHNDRVVRAIEALRTRLIEETVFLQNALNALEEAGTLSNGCAETESQTNNKLSKLISQIPNPRNVFYFDSDANLDVYPVRRGARYKASYIAETLKRIYSRVSVDDISVTENTSMHSRLYINLAYYRMALIIAARILDTNSKDNKKGKSKATLKQCLGRVQVACDRLERVPTAIVQRFDEKSYLQNNADIQSAVAAGKIFSGLEHFALQGVGEIVQGSRSASLIDLEMARSVSCNKIGQTGVREIMSSLETSGIFDAKWYKRTYKVRVNPLKHYCEIGFKQNNAPNAHFDIKWYTKRNPTIDTQFINPAYHYILFGENQGCMPAEHFDPLWYKEKYGVMNGLALSHYIRKGVERGCNPNRLFDREYYLKNNLDVAKAKQDPVTHFYQYGWTERRKPCAEFDINSYIIKYLNNTDQVNPVTHALLVNNKSGITGSAFTGDTFAFEPTSHSSTLNDIASNIKHFANPGPDFELASEVNSRSLKALAKTVAFYLPQYHAFEQNDSWWGTGFTEWRNVTRGTPRFSGHYQPRIPRDLGFYDLNNQQVLIDQSKMAMANGIEAFCFYYYWFNGQRLMDMPLDSFAKNDAIDQEFCIMWANENWTRTWDGFDNEVLMEQNYRDEDEQAFLQDTARYFRHERYMRINGRPLFILYRPGLVPKAAETIGRWRDVWEKMLGIAPYILMVQGFDESDPTKFGLDGAIEFPPHKICTDVQQVQQEMNILDPNFSGTVLKYDDVITASLSVEAPEYPLIKTVVPHWDNDARREGRGYTLHGSTPDLYEKWLSGAVSYAEANPVEGESIVFVNAWNEWAEGAYLEPDVHYGHAYLNATKRAVYGLRPSENLQKLLLVGHDAFKHGAQMLLMSMAETYKRQFGMDVTILLKSGGPLLEQYKRVCNTVVIGTKDEKQISEWLQYQKFEIAICNTSVTGDVIPVLKASGIKTISLIHELPNLIKEYKLEQNLQHIVDNAGHVVFPSNMVLDGFSQFVETENTEVVIKPQGTYKEITYDSVKRSQIRSELSINEKDKIVLNVGYADLRKGFDLFLNAARTIIADRQDIHFVWAGEISIDMQRWVESDLDSNMRSQIHLVGFTNHMSDYYSACDCLFLTSREDPYPTVVLEAMDVGMPVVLFKNATGFDSVIAQYGHVVDRNDSVQIAHALVQSLYSDNAKDKQDRRDYIAKHCQFDDYCFSLLEMLLPRIKKISVVVPNYNYGEYLQDRLLSVFNQAYPIFEMIVLDDCSSDSSVEMLEQISVNTDRKIRVVVNEKNSGNVFSQWRKAILESRGDLLWIAEADDLADPSFLNESVEAISDNTALTFTNSLQVGSKGETLAPNYDYYYDTINRSLFSDGFDIKGQEFIKEALSIKNVILNVSSVLWNKQSLKLALDSVGDELSEYKLVGDWRLYLEVLSYPEMTVSYLSKPLNVHRRHEDSVTHSLDHERHIAEIQDMHQLVRQLIQTDSEYDKASDRYLSELKVQFGLEDSSRAA